jgi:RimJ/RimL family protein N-acetyltransferase
VGERFFFARYRPSLAGHLTTPRDWRDRIETLAAFAEPPEVEVVVCHGPSGVPIGVMNLAGIDTVNGKAEFSVCFLRGRGTRAIWEAIHFALRYSFETLELRKLVLHTLGDNRQALAMLERFGARPEGILRAELAMPDGSYADLQRYAVFREGDWPRIAAALVNLAPLAESVG